MLGRIGEKEKVLGEEGNAMEGLGVALTILLPLRECVILSGASLSRASWSCRTFCNTAPDFNSNEEDDKDNEIGLCLNTKRR